MVWKYLHLNVLNVYFLVVLGIPTNQPTINLNNGAGSSICPLFSVPGRGFSSQGCSFYACTGYTITVNGCPSYQNGFSNGVTCGGDTASEITDSSGSVLASNDDSTFLCTYNSVCTGFTYTVQPSVVGCQLLTVLGGCFAKSCSGSLYVTIAPPNPTSQPTSQPSNQPTLSPSRQPTNQPSSQPTEQPASNPSNQPSSQPSGQPTSQPSSQPTCQPLTRPTRQPSGQPTAQPFAQPSSQPSGQPSTQPSSSPTLVPSIKPTPQPTIQLNPSGSNICPYFSLSSGPQFYNRGCGIYACPGATITVNGCPSYNDGALNGVTCVGDTASQLLNAAGTVLSTNDDATFGCSTSAVCTGFSYKVPVAVSGGCQVYTVKGGCLYKGCAGNLYVTVTPLWVGPSLQPTALPSPKPTPGPTSRPTFIPTIPLSKYGAGSGVCPPFSMSTGGGYVVPGCGIYACPGTTITVNGCPSAYGGAAAGVVCVGDTTSALLNQGGSVVTLNDDATFSCSYSSACTGFQYTVPQNTSIGCQIYTLRGGCWNKACSGALEVTVLPISNGPTYSPTARPTPTPTAIATAAPTAYPTLSPSFRPSPNPSLIPTLAATATIALCPAFTLASGPAYYPTGCGVYACAGSSIVANGCPSAFNGAANGVVCIGDTSSQLANPLGTIVASNNDASYQCSYSALCTGFVYTVPATSPCMTYTVKGGCASGACAGAIAVEVVPSSNVNATLYLSPTSQPSRQPSRQPTRQPSSQPAGQPSRQPSHQPSVTPVSIPTAQPTSQPSIQPSELPTQQPSSQPSSQPTSQPSGQPSSQPSAQPSAQPSTQPTSQPLDQPSRRPSLQPSQQPTQQPMSCPSAQPSYAPIARPTRRPSAQPSSQPTRQPILRPSTSPSGHPSQQPVSHPTSRPSDIKCRYCLSPGDKAAIVLMVLFGFTCYALLVAWYMGWFNSSIAKWYRGTPSMADCEEGNDDDVDDDDGDDDYDDEEGRNSGRYVDREGEEEEEEEEGSRGVRYEEVYRGGNDDDDDDESENSDRHKGPRWR